MTLLKQLGPYMRYIAVVLIALVFGIVLDRQNSEQFRVDQRLALIEVNNGFQSALEREINEKILVSEGAMAAFAAQPDMSAAEFARVVGQLVRNTDDVINVAAAPDLVIEYVYPFIGNQAAIGLDISQRPDLMGAVLRAIETGDTVFDGPIDLVQGGRGFLTRSAVNAYASGDAYLSGDSRDRFWGVVSLVIDADGLFRSAGLTNDGTGYAYVVQAADGRILNGTESVLSLDPVYASVEAPGINWTLSMAPEDGWITSPPNRLRLWATVLALCAVTLILMRVFRWAFDKKDAAETQLSEAIGALDDGFALYDSSDRLLMCNQRYKDLYALSAERMVPGTRFEDIIRYGVESGQYPQAEGREEDWIRERVAAHRNPSEVMEQQLSDGRWLRIVERKTPSGSVAGFRVDITELKEALAESEAANAAKNEFLNTVSHELRTPLTVVLGYNAFLRNPDSLPSFKKTLQNLQSDNAAGALEHIKQFKGDIEKFSQHIEVSGKHLKGLITSILDLAAIEEGTLQVTVETVELDPIVREVVQQFQSTAKEKKIEFKIDSQAKEIVADPERLSQILRNLIGNAIKFTDEGQITVRTRSAPGRAWIEVEDTGCGIPQADLKHVFERFGQLDASNSRRHGGVGLGLPIAKHLAEMQGGTISVASTEDKGSVFRVELAAPIRTRGAAAH